MRNVFHHPSSNHLLIPKNEMKENFPPSIDGWVEAKGSSCKRSKLNLYQFFCCENFLCRFISQCFIKFSLHLPKDTRNDGLIEISSSWDLFAFSSLSLIFANLFFASIQSLGGRRQISKGMCGFESNLLVQSKYLNITQKNFISIKVTIIELFRQPDEQKPLECRGI